MALKTAGPFPIFPPNLTPSRRIPTTEIRFSRWNNANAEPFLRRERDQKLIEDDIRRLRRYQSATKIAETPDDSAAETSPSSSSSPGFKSHGTPSSPSSPSIPGKSSKYSKPPQNPRNPSSSSHPAFRRIARASKAARVPPESDVESGISVGERGISYRVKHAPFEFQYSYTETPKVKPLALREPPFLPFGPSTMPRPWTGRAPLPASKKKLPEFDSFRLPPPGKKGVKPVQAPGPYLAGSGPKYTAASREEVLGDPLTEEEVKALIKGCLKTSRQLNIGRDGLTHNMLDNIHAHWKRRRVCKIKCKGVCTVDLDNVRQQLEEKTGGKVIYNRGGVMFLFRGRNYNYRTRPRFPLMLWKPVTPVYPRLVQRVPEGLTLEEATEMRKRGRKLPPICKLGKNGVYSDLYKHVKEAFEACELVRIDCKEMNKSDCRRIGAKLKDLVPCVLISFEFEHILVWRGKDWKSSLPPSEDNHTEPAESTSDGPTTTSLGTADSLNEQLNIEMPIHNMALLEDCVSTEETEDIPILEVSGQSLTVPTEMNEAATSSILSHQEIHDLGAGNSSNEDSCPETPCRSISKVINSDNIETSAELKLLQTTESLQCQDPKMSSGLYLAGVMLLLKQAVESGSAVVLDNESLDSNMVYERAVALAKTSPPGPIFRHRIRKTVVQKPAKQDGEKHELYSEAEVVTVSEKEGNGKKNSRSRKREDFREGFSGVVPQGSLRVDELAKLLA